MEGTYEWRHVEEQLDVSECGDDSQPVQLQGLYPKVLFDI